MTMTADDVRGTSFGRCSRLKRGYETAAVDDFVESVARRLETGTGVTSNDAYHVRFGKAALADRGYLPEEVDVFLERVQVELRTLEGSNWAASHPPASAPPGDDEHLGVIDIAGDEPTGDGTDGSHAEDTAESSNLDR